MIIHLLLSNRGFLDLKTKHLLFVDNPGRPLVRAEGHRTQDWDRYPQAGLAQAAILNLRLLLITSDGHGRMDATL